MEEKVTFNNQQIDFIKSLGVDPDDLDNVFDAIEPILAQVKLY